MRCHCKDDEKIPEVKLNNGQKIPIIGLGTWKSKPGEVQDAVKYAIDIGYRHIDCAHVYENEAEIGEAIEFKINEGVIKRSDIFITSKLWNTFHRADLVEGAIRTTLANLKVDYLDLYLIHWPFAYKEDEGMFPKDGCDNIILSFVDYVETWQAMEEVFRKGLTTSIGVSNFNKSQIERLLSYATIKPVINQVECHPYLNQKRLIEFCKSKDIVVTGYSPLGSPDRPWAKPGDPKLLEDRKLKEVAATYRKTPAQIVLRYQVQRGVVTIPKSVTPERIKENFRIFNFKLSDKDMEYLDSFDCNGRFVILPHIFGHPYHPFEKDAY